MNSSTELISARREEVLQSYRSAEVTNRRLYLEGDTNATEEYIFPNQQEDANNIVDIFQNRNCRVVSIQKKTKVGADGLMLEVAKLMATHSDDEFVINPKNIRILTGMSNVKWEKDMIQKAPSCFKDIIFHHGKLSKTEMSNISNGLFFIDEIDTGDKEFQRLHTTLKESGILDVHHMIENNNRFVFISATMIRELYDLYRWGDLHQLYKMTIPPSYIGHKDFLDKGIIKEFYSLSSKGNAEKWAREDILENYGDDFRIHIVRGNGKSHAHIHDACIRNGIDFRDHTSNDRIPETVLKNIFENKIQKHIVLCVKRFFTRANLIPNLWKLRIGATHELYTRKVDNSVQIQGFPGRMSGYWRDVIESGHKTGPHRTSVKAIEQYEIIYNDPFGNNSYQSAGFKKYGAGKVVAEPTLVTPKNIENLETCDLPVSAEDPTTIPIVLNITPSEYASISKISNQWDFRTIAGIIQKYRPDTIPELERIEQEGGRDQIVEPTEKTYSVYIQEFVDAMNNNRKHNHMGNITKKDKSKDTFQVYLDKFGHRIIISIYNGSKTKKS